MSQNNTALSSLIGESADVAVEEVGSIEEVSALLVRAAELASAHGLPTDAFMRAAWTACLDARPGLREQLADKELTSQLRKLRKQGLVGQA